MHSSAKREKQIPVLPGILASAFAVLVGVLILIFAYPSFGRQGEYGYLLSPAAGAILFILLGLCGGQAGFLARERPGAVRLMANAIKLSSLIFLALLAFFREWAACISIITIAATCWAARRQEKNAPMLLFIFAGLSGFTLGQAAMSFIPYGWKTWSISGVLFVFCAIDYAAKNYMEHLSLPGCRDTGHHHILWSALSLLIILIVIAMLIHVPAAMGPKTTAEEAQGAEWEADLGTINELAGEGPGQKSCDCDKSTPVSGPLKNQSCRKGALRAIILSPQDARTFPRGESIQFAALGCEEGPIRYLWRSSLDGIIGRNRSFQIDSLKTGWHNITLTITDQNGTSASQNIEIAIAAPWVCSKVSPRPKYYPIDTPCQDIWPNASTECQEIEVCHPDLDYIVAEAADCCDSAAVPGSACAYACNNSGGDKKKCRGLYIIRALGPDAKYMRGYALFKACCSGYPECTRTCWPGLAKTCSFRDGFNDYVQNLSCRPEDWGVSAWRSDTNMSMNSAVLGLFPTHATVNILHTGVCIDYAAAVTTLLRKAGYSRAEAFSTASTGYDLPLLGNHPGHAFNLVLLPGDSRYTIVDTTGNGEGINPGALPHYFWFTGCFLGQAVNIRVFDWWVGYCSKASPYGYNDGGDARMPTGPSIHGCSQCDIS
ncbi:Uncharacterised protein [uncultured archaeon]|nr:Uncharacterised protein [uncultured archaeon]